MMQTITDEYARLNAEMHRKHANYGANGSKCAAAVIEAANRVGAKTILDYGCGKQTLKAAIGHLFDVSGYDPAFPHLLDPRPADLVTCTDVMEHVEPDCLDATIAHIFSMAGAAALFVISCEKGIKRLGNGQLAHCSVHPADWWEFRLSAFGEAQRMPKTEDANEAVFLVMV